MLISTAMAATEAAAAAPGDGEVLGLNVMMVVIMVALFYVLLIMPQQKRFKKHREMLDQLKKGDRVLTTSGLIATIEQMEDGKDEVVLDLGNGQKVTAIRMAIQNKYEPEAANANTKEEPKPKKSRSK